MLTNRQHVLPTQAPSTNESTMGMPQNMPKEPKQGQPGATEATQSGPQGPERTQEQPKAAPPPRNRKALDYVLT